MLVIRRRPGQSLLIGPDIEVEVVDLSAGRVKLGVRAPREVLILRKEARLAAEQNLAASRNLSAETLRLLVSRLRRA
jgi:carbon storage regulator